MPDDEMRKLDDEMRNDVMRNIIMMDDIKEKLGKIWKSREFQIGMDICRILMLIIVILIFLKLVTEIEAVKLLNYDPCKLCMNKTGAVCFYTNSNIQKDAEGREIRIIEKKIPVYPEINATIIEDMVIKDS